MRFSARSAERGMTLIEIMVVMFILGLIGSIVAISVRGTDAEARLRKARIDMSVIAQGLEMYRLKKGRLPTTAEGIVVLYESATLAGRPGTDPWGNAYVYESPAPGEPDGYVLRSLGPDGRPGGDDLVPGEE